VVSRDSSSEEEWGGEEDSRSASVPTSISAETFVRERKRSQKEVEGEYILSSNATDRNCDSHISNSTINSHNDVILTSHDRIDRKSAIKMSTMPASSSASRSSETAGESTAKENNVDEYLPQGVVGIIGYSGLEECASAMNGQKDVEAIIQSDIDVDGDDVVYVNFKYGQMVLFNFTDTSNRPYIGLCKLQKDFRFEMNNITSCFHLN